MKFRVQKTANIDPETMKTIAKDTMYHIFVDMENGQPEKYLGATHDTDGAKQRMNDYKEAFNSFMDSVGGNK